MATFVLGRTRRRWPQTALMVLALIWMVQWLSYRWSFTSSLDAVDRVQPRVLIAANLHNSEEILPSMTRELVRLAQMLGPSRTFVSIYENGSRDSTPKLLKAMNETLARAGVARRILSEPNKEKPSNVRRIPYLAGMRNRLLEPLESDSFDYVLFLNDVVFVAEDAITLLASRGMDYDAVCGLDFYWSFYDFFATRMTSGLALGSGYYPYTEMTEEQALVRNDQPFPVFSCWNGMAAFRADPFTRDKVRFRALKPELATVEYEASECCLVHADLRASGHTRIFINPMVKVAYHWRFYFLHNSVLPWFNGLFLLFNRPDGHAYLRAVARNGDGSRTDEYLSDSPLEAMCVQ